MLGVNSQTATLFMEMTMLVMAAGAAQPGEAAGALAVAMGLLGGTALLMYGLDRLSAALKRLAGGRLRQTLTTLTRTPLSAFLTGIGVTALTQSSTVVTVTVVGLASTGLLSMAQAMPIILGANIGTTITAQLIAFDVAGQALWLVGLGYAASQLKRWPRTMLGGEAVFGLGLVFLGLHTLISAMQPLRSAPAVLDALSRMEQPLLGFGAGLLLAGVLHSSAAVIGIALALCAQGLLPLTAGLAISLGAEVGTCSTALLASLGRGAPARRVALAHLIFNGVSALCTLPLIPILAAAVESLSQSVPRQLANGLTLFNVAWALAFLCFNGPLASLVSRLVPDRTEELGPLLPAKYLSPDYLGDPELAFAMVRRELGRIGRRIEPLLAELPDLLQRSGSTEQAPVEQLRRDVNELYDQLTAYLGRISLRELPGTHAQEFLGLMRAANGLNQIMHLVANLSESLAEGERPLAPEAAAYSAPFHAVVLKAMQRAQQAIEHEDQSAAQAVSEQKPAVEAQLRELRLRAAAELKRQAGADGFEQAFAQLMNLLEHEKRIYYYARRSARTVLPDPGGAQD